MLARCSFFCVGVDAHIDPREVTNSPKITVKTDNSAGAMWASPPTRFPVIALILHGYGELRQIEPQARKAQEQNQNGGEYVDAEEASGIIPLVDVPARDGVGNQKHPANYRHGV